ncbi:MAG: NAD(P)H-dependent oxidoreductase [Proteobacteria bacterium]|nr:NAD(P)H-dependent oxidoreductase [Pseudomonadota bacterium]
MTRRQFPPAPTHPGAVVLGAHPQRDSFNNALAQAWISGARSRGLTVDHIHVHELEFDVSLRGAYREEQALEPDLVRVRDAIEAAAHLVIASPTWWASSPAALRGLIDRVFLPGWAFRYENHRPVPGLSGRSARLLATMDAPLWYDWLVNRGASRRQLTHGTLRFSGFRPVHTTAFGSVGSSTAEQRAQMLGKAEAAGVSDALRLVRLPALATVRP